MKAVIDTNVIVSGLLKPEGLCGGILRQAMQGEIEWCLDERILEEYETVLRRPMFRVLPEELHRVFTFTRLRTERINPVPLAVELPDPSDLPFLEVAAAVNAILVTGNIKHSPKHTRAGVTVVTPKEFIDLLRRPV